MENLDWRGAVRMAFGVAMALALAACGQPSPPDDAAAARVLQVKLAKQFVGSTCRFFALDDFGYPVGDPIGPFGPLSDGRLSLGAAAPGSGLLQCAGGRYVDDSDPAGIREIALGSGDVVEAFVADGQTSVRVDIFSQVLVNFARRAAAGADGNFLGYFTAAQRAFEQRFPGVFSDGLTDAGRDLINGGVANLLNAAAIVNGLPSPTVEVLQALIDDLGDGSLDGALGGRPVSVNGRNLPALDLNAAIRRFRNNQFSVYGSTPLPEVTVQPGDAPIGDITPDTPANRPPRAVSDLLVGLPGQVLTVAAPGVLANDSDPDGDELQAVLIDPVAPELGVLTLAPDGSVIFTPAAGAGDELRAGFTYQITDGAFIAQASSEVILSSVPVVSVADAEVTEGESGTADLVFRLTIDQNTLAAGDSMEIDVSTADVTAVASEDYEALADTVIVQPGQTEATVTVTVFGDDVAEPDETLELLLGVPRVISAELGTRDGVLVRASATGTIVSDDFMQPPVAVPDQAQTNEDTAVTIDVLANDTDVNVDDTLTVAAADAVTDAGGTVTFGPAAVIYTPAPDFFGTDSFAYTVTDGELIDNTTVTVEVLPVDDPPTAADDSFDVAEDSRNRFDVLANDSIAPDTGETLSVTAVSTTQRGAFVGIVDNGAALEYQPAANDFGVDTFTYTVTDSSGSTASATVTVNILGRNDAPVAANLSLMGNEDSPVSGTLAATDDEGQAFYFAIVDQPVDGTLTAFDAVSGDFTFLPKADFNGTASFTYQAIEGTAGGVGGAVRAKLASSPATVTITVAPVNDAPVVSDLALTTAENGPVSGNLAGSDVDGDAFFYQVVTAPVNGALSTLDVNTGAFTYTPAANFNGSDAFTYRVVEGVPTGGVGAKLSSAVATVSLTVTAVDAPPTFNLVSSTVTVSEDDPAQSLTQATLIDDGDPELVQTLAFTTTVTAVDNPSLFSAAPAIDSAGTLTFTPAAAQSGTATVSVTLSDGTNTTSAQTFMIVVTAVDDPPSFSLVGSALAFTEDDPAQSLTQATSIDDGDPDLTQTLTFTVSVIATDNPSLFSAAPAIDDTGVLTFTLGADENGSATVSVTLSDGANTTAAQTFTIDVAAVDDPPSFLLASSALTINEDDPAQSLTQATSIDDGDPELTQTLTFTVSVTATDNPSLFSAAPAIDSAGTLTYTPAANENGSATVSVILSDGTTTTAEQTFTIDVVAVNDPPTFSLVSVPDQTVLEDSGAATVSGFVTASDDGDPELAQTITYTLNNDNNALFSAQPVVDGSGVLTFTPLADGNGAATVTMTADDSGGASSTAQTFTITVTPVNDAPTLATTDFYRPFDSGTVSIDLSGFINFGPSDESMQSVLAISGVSNDNTVLFAAQPAVMGSVLSFQFAGDALGVANVMLTIQDNGGTANMGVDTTTTALKLWSYPALELADTDTGVQPDAGGAINPVISGDGRYVVFQSATAVYSVSPAMNASQQIYRRDMQTGALELISETAGGTAGTADSTVPCVSYDGSLVAFATQATELGGSAANPQFVIKDMYDGSVTAAGVMTAGDFYQVATDERCDFSTDGLAVVFAAEANMGDGMRIFQTPSLGGLATEIVSFYVPSDPQCGPTTPCSGPSASAYFSSDALGPPFAVTYTTDASYSQATDGWLDVWAWNNCDGLCVDPVSSGRDQMVPTPAPTRAGDAGRGDVDALGRYVVYETAENQAPGVIPQPAIALRDLDSLASPPLRALVNAPMYPTPIPSPPPTLAPAGAAAVAGARDPYYEPRISGDGRFVVWSGSQDELGTPPSNAGYTIYVKEVPAGGLASASATNTGGQVILTGRVARIHISQDAGVFDADSAFPQLDFQGKYIVFQSVASNVLAGGADTNGAASDVFRVLNPLWTEDTLADFDGDGVLLDTNERALGTNPTSLDSDQDLLPDDQEVAAGDPLLYDVGTADTDPTNPDTDGDTCFDGEEVYDLTDPNDPASYCGAPGAPTCGFCAPVR